MTSLLNPSFPSEVVLITGQQQLLYYELGHSPCLWQSHIELGAKMLFNFFLDLHHTLPQGQHPQVQGGHLNMTLVQANARAIPIMGWMLAAGGGIVSQRTFVASVLCSEYVWSVVLGYQQNYQTLIVLLCHFVVVFLCVVELSFYSLPVIMFYDGNVTSYFVCGYHGDMYSIPSPLHLCVPIIERYCV